MFWLSRWTYSGVPGFGPAACDGAASARARRAARRQMRPIAGSVTRWDATQNACVAWLPPVQRLQRVGAVGAGSECPAATHAPGAHARHVLPAIAGPPLTRDPQLEP